MIAAQDCDESHKISETRGGIVDDEIESQRAPLLRHAALCPNLSKGYPPPPKAHTCSCEVARHCCLIIVAPIPVCPLPTPYCVLSDVACFCFLLLVALPTDDGFFFLESYWPASSFTFVLQ